MCPRWRSLTAPEPFVCELSSISVMRKQQTQHHHQKSGLRSTSKDSGRRLKRVKMMRARCRPGPANPLTSCSRLTTLALIRGDTGPSNLLSAQFLGTMEFRAHRYAILLTALCLAAWLMRWRLPTGEPNGVKTEAPRLDKRSLHWRGQRVALRQLFKKQAFADFCSVSEECRIDGVFCRNATQIP